jgi:hypothetical protein
MAVVAMEMAKSVHFYFTPNYITFYIQFQQIDNLPVFILVSHENPTIQL